jgi:ABC-type Fe3+-hydroxamate transport system substrate-binding protein
MGGMRIALAVCALALLAAGTACGERTEPTGATVRIYPVTVQGAAERPTAVAEAPHRIVPLGPGPHQILRALGLDHRIVSVDDSLVGLPLVAQIKKARPDLIVASSDVDPLDLARARSATNAAVYVTPDSSLDDVTRTIGDIGLLTGRPVAARRVTAAIERDRRQVASRLSGSPAIPTFIDVGNFSTIGSRSLLGSIVEAAKGTDVAGPTPDQGPFPLKRLASLDPKAYVALSSGGTTLAQLRSNHMTKKLAAVRAGRFGIVPSRLAQPGPDVGKALLAVARILHPDDFR